MSNKYSDISLTWEGDITSMSSWAQHVRAILKPLVLGGASVRINIQQPTRPERVLDKWWEEQFGILTKAEPGLVKFNHGSVSNTSPNTTGGPLILFTHWETHNIPQRWVHPLNNAPFKEVWVPSAKMLTDDKVKPLVKPCRHLDFPINVKFFDKFKEPIDISEVGEGTTVFGAVGQWNQRRNLSDLIIAYLTEFNANDDVALVVKTFGNNIGNVDERNRIHQLIAELKRSMSKDGGLPRVVVIQDIFNYETFYGIMRRFDIFCSSSRGESTNISMKIAGAMGKPCIYLDVGPNQEFTELGSPLMHPVDYVFEPVMSMGNIYSAKDYWARPNVMSYALSMRKAYIDATAGRSLLRPESEKLIQKVDSRWGSRRVLSDFVNNYQLAMGQENVIKI
jgi:glycosyltransferase involved in cell wall biosynthesis